MIMRLALNVVQEWYRLGDQAVVGQQWKPGAVACLPRLPGVHA